MYKWFEALGENEDIVIASGVRLSRNLEKYPFSKKISDSDAIHMVEEVLKEFETYADEEFGYIECNLGELSEIEKFAMVERQILSKEIAVKKQCSGLVMSEDESTSILINEEDHLKIQSLAGGANMQKAYEKASEVDDYASESLEMAFSEKYGYLTSSPSNVGTGLRASYLMFLPALGGANKINRLSEEVMKYGVGLKGVYGDGAEGVGHIYELYNEKTLGSTEAELLENLRGIMEQVAAQERKRREYLLANNYDEIEDQVFRSYGVLKYAKQMNSKDAMTLLSQIKFGADVGIIQFEKPLNIYKMIMEVQPYSLQCRSGKYVGSKVRDKLRAQYLGANLSEVIN